MASKKKSTWDTEDTSEDTYTDVEDEGAEKKEQPEQEKTSVQASEDGIYCVDQDINIKGVAYKRGDKVNLTPEELESVQASGVKMLPVA